VAAGTHNPQSGDAFARVGAPVGASISADVAAVKVDTAAILIDTGTTLDGRIPAALVSGRMDVSVGAMAAGVVTAAAVATGAIDADALATDAVAEIADGVWDEALSGHAVSGSTGAALSAAGAAGDPWSTALPGAYGAGTAGLLLGTTMLAAIAALPTDADVNAACDTAISDAALATAASLATVDGIVDTILVDTAELQSDWANGGRLDIILDARAPAADTTELLTRLPDATAGATGGVAIVGSAMTLTAGERTALGSALGLRTVGVATQDQILQAILAALLAKTSGGGTSSIVLRNAADTANLATVTVDENDNRTAISITWANA
jgi:hypothetical protein